MLKPSPGVVRHVALLRGINVGGKNLLPMKELVALCEEAGAAEVSTYIQSGNVVFTASKDVAARLPATLAAAIARTRGLAVPVVVREGSELARVVASNPFAGDGNEDAWHVMFLADAPAADRVAALDPARSPTDRFAVVGSEVFLHCPEGLARTKLTNAWFDARLGTTSTCRNWRTVLTLVAMTQR